jgi:hypothetical protein
LRYYLINKLIHYTLINKLIYQDIRTPNY